MPKTHVVKEAFSIDGVDYPRGTEITDHDLIAKVREKFPKHVISHHHEAPAGESQVEQQQPDPDDQA